MKLLLLSVFCVFSFCAFAQAPKKVNPYLFQLPDTLKKFKGNENALQELHDYWQRKQMQNNSLANNNNRIIILPQDNMPCVVPNTNVAAKIPNAWTGVSVPYVAPVNPIPNPGLPKIQSFKWNTLDNGLDIPSK
jgi:hypothetical protein